MEIMVSTQRGLVRFEVDKKGNEENNIIFRQLTSETFQGQQSSSRYSTQPWWKLGKNVEGGGGY
jgi:hypothetical protein